MFFDDYPSHSEAQIRPSLLWEYNTEEIDWNEMRNVVVQRIIERGRPDDYYAALNLYGLQGFIEAIKTIPYMNVKDMAFVCHVFGLKKEELKCYTRQQLHRQHWNS
ncbi:hypothetical protein [Parabacteroides sp. Marseille-P3160]|uniref:DUF6922 domain-containing protein n=1 Tax=Parabacteroides sp. Marseille-P3160 TaxID=1917887 RepID=UPI0009B9A1FB|nr:hypothetical protein [Parabacteroides sp. Marseille-P3160]